MASIFFSSNFLSIFNPFVGFFFFPFSFIFFLYFFNFSFINIYQFFVLIKTKVLFLVFNGFIFVKVLLEIGPDIQISTTGYTWVGNVNKYTVRPMKL